MTQGPVLKLFLLDDGSDEPTRKILCDLASQCRNEIHVIYQENGGRTQLEMQALKFPKQNISSFLIAMTILFGKKK